MMVIPMSTILPTVVLHSDKTGQNLLSFACQRIEIAVFKTVVPLLLVIAGLTGIYKTIVPAIFGHSICLLCFSRFGIET